MKEAQEEYWRYKPKLFLRYLFFRAYFGSLINGHSIEHVIEALSPTGGTWDAIKNILRSATTPKF